MKGKLSVTVKFVFEVDGNKDEVVKSIHNQINTDLNAYWQNDDDTAQMSEIKITQIRRIKE